MCVCACALRFLLGHRRKRFFIIFVCMLWRGGLAVTPYQNKPPACQLWLYLARWYSVHVENGGERGLLSSNVNVGMRRVLFRRTKGPAGDTPFWEETGQRRNRTPAPYSSWFGTRAVGVARVARGKESREVRGRRSAAVVVVAATLCILWCGFLSPPKWRRRSPTPLPPVASAVTRGLRPHLEHASANIHYYVSM